MRLIYTTLLAAFFSLFVSNGYSQATLSRSLKDKLKNKNSEWIYISVELTQKVDLNLLQKKFRSQKTLVNERAKITISSLRENASSSQKDILKFLTQNNNYVKNIKSYWIANIITLKATPDFIYELQNQKNILRIGTDDKNYFYHQPTSAEKSPSKGLTEAEVGIYAINAPELWKLGYTGKNTVVLGVDTGVKYKHPAISENFLGKYRPLHEAWFGYSNITPDDISFSSTHGTHTLGTVLGLDNELNDTIGVAWNGYWMASDPIVSALPDVRTLDKILESFEWALNPDGDFSTVNDIPDVITNSWGWDSFYSNETCDAPEAQAINAAATAGIGIVFSAGNDGPGTSTIGQPANLAENLVNVFSVGAINGSNPSYPIADFSSRGPTTCVEECDGFSLWTKPEIVAPGVNVRSAMGNDEYGSLSGTSMACPHVAGAFLLLKEAFPYLAGEDILNGLYQSAIDLGDAGEDQTFGKGIIDVKAAYDFLSLENTPVPPIENNYDLAVSEIKNYPLGIATTNAISFDVVLKNKGLQAVQGINISIQVNNKAPENFSNNDAINSGAELTISLTDINLDPGLNRIKVYADLTIDSPESDLINNTAYFFVTKPIETNLPFNEDFDTTNFNFTNTLFSIINYDEDWSWTVDTAGGLETSEYSMRLDFTKMKSRIGQYDDLISPLLNIPESDKNISFCVKYAYAARAYYLFKDSLMISVSSDMGVTWNDTLFSKRDTSLATVNFNSGNERFVPATQDEWQQLKIDLSNYKGEKILIRFRGVNDNGSNLYIDDFMVFEGDFPASNKSIKGNNNLSLHIYPNPAKNSINISVENALNDGSLLIYNTIGKIVASYSFTKSQKRLSVNCSDYSPGVYFIKYTNCEYFDVEKVIVD
ncbi:MAG: S8 family serine peptidase [Salinivirgaceae bacterium]|nr:S8 family serine peptidase [Salinivirgaceae bacterium]